MATKRLLVAAAVAAWAVAAALGLSRWAEGGRTVRAVEKLGWLSIRVANYQAGTRGPPALTGGGPGGRFRLANSYPPDWPETQYLRRAFPDLPLAYAGPPGDLDANETLSLLLTLAETGEWPSGPPAPLADEWGTPYVVFGVGDPPAPRAGATPRPTAYPQFQIHSAGPDREFGTADDLTNLD